MSAKQFVEAYERTQAAKGYAFSSPLGDLTRWRSLVASCEEGYDLSIYEYHYELRVRDRMEAALSEPTLVEFREFTNFRNLVHEVDGRFRAVATTELHLAHPAGLNWWTFLVPPFGESPFVDTVRSAFGLELSVVDDVEP